MLKISGSLLISMLHIWIAEITVCRSFEDNIAATWLTRKNHSNFRLLHNLSTSKISAGNQLIHRCCVKSEGLSKELSNEDGDQVAIETREEGGEMLRQISLL